MSTVAASDLQDLPLVSVLFVTYKRFELLQKTVHSFIEHTSYPRLQLVIADDGSGKQIQDQIKALPVDIFALSERNRGLGANFNQGLACCTGKYVLVLQDDWICNGPADYLSEAVRVFEANPMLGLINFAGEMHPPDYSARLPGSTEPCYVTPEAFRGGPIQYFLYSDQPHLQSREAIDFIGYYLESRDMEECEVDYNHRWEVQHRFLTAVMPAYHYKVFRDEGGEQSFRTTRLRYKVQGLLQPAKPFLLKHAPTVFKGGKAAVQSVLRFLEKRGFVR